MRVVDALNGLAERGCAWAAASLVEASVLLAVAGVVLWLAGRRVSPAAAHLLLLAVLVKAMLPLGIPAPRVELPGWSERVAVMETAPQVAVASAPTTARVLEPAPVVPTIPSEKTPQVPVAPLPTVPSAAVVSQLSWKAWALMVWAVVVLGLALRRVHAQWMLRRAIRNGIPFDEAMAALVKELALRLGIRRPLAVISGPSSIAPAVAGVWRPTLIIPRDLPYELRIEQLRWVLLHELAHVRRGDLYTLWLVAAAECVAFFNPAVWMAARWAEYFRECACDELAWRHANCERSACGEAFLAILAPATARPSHAIGFRSTQRQMRRRLLRLLEPAPRDRRRAAAVALACVGVLGLFSVTQEASRAEGEVQVARRSSDAESEAASDRDASESTASDHLAETVASIDRIWEEQTHPIHSGRAVVRVLRMSSLKDPVQQGHELAQMSRLEVDAFLDSIDFVNDPNCLRKVRDGLLVGSLILDQPAFKTNEIAWNKSARRLSWSNGRTLVYDGEAFIQHDPNRRQVDLYAAPPYAWFGDQSAQEMWQKLISLNYGMRDLARRPALQKAQTLDDGSRRLTFEANSTRREFGDINSLNWVIGGDGKLQSIELSFQYHVIRQFGFQPYGRNVVVPQVSIDAEYSGWTPAGDHEILLGLTVSVIEEAEFNTEIPQDVFRVAVPANTAVWDRRTELKLRAAEVATEDVLTLFER